ncbi:hypothetical protein [Methylobacterium sp. E-045]|uniref:hypothetical protein n=1 Tax=Methylobacterium sp. E-045 TaxID=2836575 RepID=UPI001FB8BBD8|nr:hypothetical protein [Methylobacterium sp. E-045]MCJ2131447.1 hypothetical protein [Methylobacterium sp. E-045]
MLLSALFLAIALALVLSGLAMSERREADMHDMAAAAVVTLVGLLFFVAGLALAAIHALTLTP